MVDIVWDKILNTRVFHDHTPTMDALYLKILSNLGDLNDVGTARTNLGLVAGGTGDIWVEKAGDTMTGDLEFTGAGVGIDADKIKIAKYGTPTYTNLQHAINLIASPGLTSGGNVTDAGGETVDIAAGTGWIKATDSDVAEILSFDWDAVSGAAIATDTVKYAVVEYGTPPVATIYDGETWDLDTSFPLAKIVNEGGTIHILNNPWWVGDSTANIIERIIADGIIVRDQDVGGLVLSVPGTRGIGVTAGKLWSRLSEFDIPAHDTSTPQVASHSAVFDVDNGSSKGTITASSGTPYTALMAGDYIAITGTGDNDGTYKIETVTGGNVITMTTVIAGTDGTEAATVITQTVELYWRTGAAAWSDSHVTQYPITQYNRLSDNSLQTIPNNQYFNWWIYVECDDLEVVGVYPQAYYPNAATAETEAPPSSVPVHVSENGILIGRILCKQGTDVPVQVQSAWSQQFTASAAADHGNLAGLSDDDHAQYLLASDATDRATFAAGWTDLTDGGDTTAHDHDGISENTSARHTQGTDTALGAVSAKNPPIDADKVLYRDSTAADALVTSTWTQVKAFLKTYFDTLYSGASSGQYRQHTWVASSGGGWEFVSLDDEPVFNLADLE